MISTIWLHWTYVHSFYPSKIKFTTDKFHVWFSEINVLKCNHCFHDSCLKRSAYSWVTGCSQLMFFFKELLWADQSWKLYKKRYVRQFGGLNHSIFFCQHFFWIIFVDFWNFYPFTVLGCLDILALLRFGMS